jgi:hypothetical protein
VAFPPSSPDLTPKGFFQWSHIKALISSSPVDSKEDCIARIIKSAATIRQQPSNFECTRQSLLLWRRLYIEAGGHTFEHLL